MEKYLEKMYGYNQLLVTFLVGFVNIFILVFFTMIFLFKLLFLLTLPSSLLSPPKHN
jgi:hypothetical protein